MSEPTTSLAPQKLVSWDILHQRALVHEALTESERLAAADAVMELKSILGEQLFESKHSLVGFFINRAAGPLKWAIWFAKVLTAIRQHPDFDRLVADLRKPDKFGERMTILNISDILSAAGFTFTLDKEIQINGKPKKPDLLVQLNDADPGLFIEVTTLGASEKEREANDVFRAISDTLWRSFGLLHYSGRVERILSPRHLDEVLQKVQAMVIKAHNETGFETLKIDGVICLAVATAAKAAEMENWAKSQGLQPNQFCGPRVEVSEMDRLSFKLKTEQVQLPPDRTNVVVIYTHLFQHSPNTPESFGALANAIEDAVYRHSHIGYLVLVFSWIGVNSKESYRLRDHLCINRERFGHMCQTFMLFKNRFAAKPMPSAIEEKFLEAFMSQTGKPDERVDSRVI